MPTSLVMHESVAISLLLAQAEEKGTSWLETIQSGGVVGYIIIALSVVALAFVVLHLVQIRRSAIIPQQHLDALNEMLAQGDVAGALEYCLDPEHDSFLTRVMAPGLTRFQKSAFGAFEIKNSVEEAGEEQTARLYRSTDMLNVIGSISPLLGLLGTVIGIVGAFETLSAGAAPDHKTLAGNISLALVTTLLGLIVAIPCMALYTYFRNRIDACVAEAGQEIELLLLHLEAGEPGAAPSPRPGPMSQAAGTRGGPAVTRTK